MSSSLPDLRREYARAILRRRDLAPEPFAQFDHWFAQALEAQVPEPNAMTLATADARGRPSSRVVLLKGIARGDQRGFIFYTNYQSRKGRDLAENPFAAVTFYWIELERQMGARGPVTRLPPEESRAYFHTRPRGAQLGAWASDQSSVIANREILEQKLNQCEIAYRDREVPIPPHWGGFILLPDEVEFWQGGPNRLHDRFRYRREQEQWILERLSP